MNCDYYSEVLLTEGMFIILFIIVHEGKSFNSRYVLECFTVFFGANIFFFAISSMRLLFFLLLKYTLNIKIDIELMFLPAPNL